MKTSQIPNVFKIMRVIDVNTLSRLERTINTLYNRPNKLSFIRGNLPIIIREYMALSNDRSSRSYRFNICPFCSSKRGCEDEKKGNSFTCIFTDDRKYRICFRKSGYFTYIKIHMDINYNLKNNKFKIISIVPILNKRDMLDVETKYNFPSLTNKKVVTTDSIKMSVAAKDENITMNDDSEKQMKLTKRLQELKSLLEEKEKYHLSLLNRMHKYDIEEINTSDEMKYKIDFI